MTAPGTSGPRQISEAARSVDVILDTDVLVVGSGPGGLAAALGAARAGARTALEQCSYAHGNRPCPEPLLVAPRPGCVLVISPHGSLCGAWCVGLQ